VGKREGKRPADLYGRIILICIFRKRDGVGIDWIDLVQDRDTVRAIVNAVMNLQVPQNVLMS
jgi:hypothetical protein